MNEQVVGLGNEGKITHEATPNAVAVAGELDVTLVKDLIENTETGKTSTVYALGAREDLAAGLRGFEVTPHFDSLAELESFCSEHRKEFQEAAEAESFPESWFWEAKRANA